MQTSNMPTFSSPQDYNKQLVENDIEIAMIEYIDNLNTMFYNIDISFMIDFMELVGQDEFIVPHHLLFKYGILNSHILQSVLQLINTYKLVESVDYVKSNTEEKNKY